MTDKEVDLEGKAKDALETHRPRLVDQRVEQGVTHAPANPFRTNRERANLGKVGPHDVKRPAANDLIGLIHSHEELLDVLKIGHKVLGDEDALVRVRLDEVRDRVHVRGQGWAQPERAGLEITHVVNLLRVGPA